MRKKRPLERSPGTVRDATLIIIASEDEYAVKQYFEFFRSNRVKFQVLPTTDGRSAPQHVMARLDDYMKEYQFGDGDEFWLVCDSDHWIQPGHIQNLRDVIRECSQKRVNVALSNPCFDLWLLLHFADQPEGSPSCTDLGDYIRDAVGHYDKKKIYNLPIDMNCVQRAIERSVRTWNPSVTIPTEMMTSVHLILAELAAQHIVKTDGEP